MIEIPQRVKAFFLYSRTVFLARLYTFAGGAAVTFAYIVPFLQGQDFTPVFVRLFSWIPDDLRPLVISAAIAGTGELFVYLRKITDQSLAENAKESETPS